MKVTREVYKIIADLEYIIGSECYNPNSYDGWNGIEGCAFRYPINIQNIEGNYVKIKGNINDSYLLNIDDVSEKALICMKYKFGTNQLYIGRGILNVLNYLEDRYSISFNELEKNIK